MTTEKKDNGLKHTTGRTAEEFDNTLLLVRQYGHEFAQKTFDREKLLITGVIIDTPRVKL